MRIIHVLNTNSYSGAENVAIQLAEHFKKNNDVFYCCPKGPIEKILEKHGISHISIKKLSVKELKRVARIIKPDLVHAHDFRASLFSILSFKKTPVVSHLHNKCPWLKKVCIKTVIFYFIAKKCNAILTVSNSVMDEFIFVNKFKTKTTVIGNPVDTSLLRYGVFPKRKRIYDLVFCGRMTEQKNPLLFIDIVKELVSSLPSIRIAMLGDGELMNTVKESISSLGLTDNIIVFGFVNNPIVFMSESKVLVITSSWEGFGLVAVEAMSVGTPVVASKVGGLPTIVDDKCGALCNSKDEFVKEIKKIIIDEKYFRLISLNALKKADALSNIEQYIENISNIYNSLLRVE